MAKKKPAVQEENEIKEVYSKTERYFVENKKSLTIILGAIVVIVGGYIGYRKFYKEPREEKAKQMVWKAQHLFDVKVSTNQADSFKMAREGVQGFYGFEYITNEFDGTMAGEVAQYSLGVILLNQGEFQAAIEQFEGVDIEDNLVSTLAIGLMGDCYAELGDYSEAISKYEEAIEHNNNEFTSPLFLKKAGLLHEENGDYGKAVSCYETILKNFEGSAQGTDIEKYIARAKNR